MYATDGYGEMVNDFETLWEDGERVFSRVQWPAEGSGETRLIARPAVAQPSPASLGRLAHEFGLKDELDGAWAVRPLALVREGGGTLLVLEDPGGEPLWRLLGAPMAVGCALRLAVGIAAALDKLHQRGLVHMDVKPVHILVNCTDGQPRLTGFGIASQLRRERATPEPPETLDGTLAYMAPEQTGRMNRSIDSRSDLYALGVTLYQMLTGVLPFTAADPMEWVHCHIARKPVLPSERLPTVPAMVCRIVMKLLAKTAEERYQTAAGVERDLRRCLASQGPDLHIDDFPLGERDTPDRLLIPEKLYGRQCEVDTLVGAFDRIVKLGTPELVLVAGYSGIGKSSVVNELQKVLVPPRGLFASGKFDQYKRDIPYSTLVQAFQSLVRQLLGKCDMELARWRGALLEALGPSARLMTDLIPELKLVIGEPPLVPELEPKQAQRRFQLVFRRFIGVFAQPDHPLALFLDDLQWLDAATLDLLEDLLTRSDLRYLLLIGAYRDNEVDVTHPLIRKLQAIKKADVKIEEITLAPLGLEHIAQLIADALHDKPAHVAPLAQLVQEKTAGNPFFVTQFLLTLADEALLTFDYDASRWRANLDRIHAKGYTANVVDLLVGKVIRLPAGTRQALQQLACLGNVAAITLLSIVLEVSETQVHAALWEALRQGLVERLKHSYRFVHDRVQGAAYSLIPEALRAEAHLRIGRLLSAQTPPEQREEAIFDIVGQLNRGAALITCRGEREQLAGFNLLAGQRAKSSTAYASALSYLSTGAALMAEDEDVWERRRELIFATELNRAECEFLTGRLSVADKRLTALSKRPTTTVERALVASLHLDVCTTMDQSGRAVAVCLDYLRHVGIEWSPHPDDGDVRREYERIGTLLGGRNIEDLIDLPRMEDAASLATVEVLMKLMPPARFTDLNLASLTICKAVSLSLELGNCDASCVAYVNFCRVAGLRFGDYQAGFRFGKLGYELVEQRALKRFEASTYLCYAVFDLRWMKHVGACRDLMRRAFDAANRIGDLTYGAYTCTHVNSNLIFAGEPLREVQDEAEHGLAYTRKARFGLVIEVITTQLALIKMLRGSTLKFGCFDDGQFNELRFEHHLSSNPALALAACWYWIRKLQARYLAGDYAAAVDAASKAQRLLWTSSLFFEQAEYHFYGALSRAASFDTATADERPVHLEALAEHQRQLEMWADICPENFENRAALVGAEIARIEGRALDAMTHYDQAIRSAQKNGFVHNEALANELAARFFSTRGFEQAARGYLQDAHDAWLRWGANGKARQLEQCYPTLKPYADHARQTATIATLGTPIEQLDLATVLSVSQIVSGEIVLENLIEALMRTAVEHAGAQRGLLVLPRGAELWIEAQADTEGDSVTVALREAPIAAAELPESILQYCARTQESVILDDASARGAFANDAYIARVRARSVLCLPFVKQGRLIALLYLENHLAAGAFTPARIAVLKVLASQAAMTLENARLYRDLAQREAKIRRLVDANIVGIFIGDLDGRLLEANDAFLRIVGYDRDDLLAGHLRWTDLTPPEWLERDRSEWVPALRMARTTQPFEKEYFRKDGSRVPVLIGVAMLDERGTQGIAFVLDLSERKRAEAEARQMQLELAHANRVTTMGQLTASISHEIKQPIAGITLNAAAALRWLARDQPDMGEVRQALDRIVRDARRADEVMTRIHGLVKKAPTCNEILQLNEAIREVMALTSSQLLRNDVSLRAQLAEDLPLIQGDRVQLQQVMLNLVINAIDAMSAVDDGPRELMISTAMRESSAVLVTVRDSGPGVAPEHIERVFEPFYTTKASGMGMGLSICRSIIDAHGGRLWASANAPRGAIFQFTAPVLPAVAA
jgi:PAS domain S-box-containing protein